MRPSYQGLNGTPDAFKGLGGGGDPLGVTLGPWRYGIGEKARLVGKCLASSNPFPQHLRPNQTPPAPSSPLFSPCAYLIYSRPCFSPRELRVRT
jgi:hypothetical protein